MIGRRFGPYEIVDKLGSGGMGEVWRARDARLDRDVAVKVLSSSVGEDSDRLRRFEQEARAAGALNHPNILTVHDVGREGETPYLVTELLEGESLRARLERGSLPLRQAVTIAIEVARGLAAAHERGIVHRDLKPENLFLTRHGGAKILDFGLAKLYAPSSTDHLATAETVENLTESGAVLGTVAYMSPEQARGESADARSDLFALGCVLFEMLAGRRPFVGRSTAEQLASMLRDSPPSLAALRPEVPPALERLVRHLLEKEPTQRFQSARDLAFDLESTLGAPAAGPRRAARANLGWPLAALAGLAALAVVAALAWIWLGSRREAPASAPAAAVQRVTQLSFAEGLEESPALSPDGARVAYSAGGSGVRHLRLRDLGSGEERELTRGELDDLQPAWSGDGRRLLFVRARTPGTRLEPGDIFGAFSGGDVWELELDSGRETRRIENAFHPAPSPDGSRIAFEADWAGGRRLWLADANGANAEQLTRDSSEAIDHLRPRWSPDGKWIAFHVQERTRFDVRLVDLATKTMRAVTDDVFIDVDPVFGASASTLYFSSYRSGGLNLWRIDLGDDGKPVGAPRQITTGAGQDVELSFDREGRRGVFAILRQNADLWSLPIDLATGAPAGPASSLVAGSREDSRGSWSPDGRSIAFNSDRGGDMNLWLFDRASGGLKQLTRGAGGDFQASWAPDGRTIAFFSSRAGSVDLWSLDVATLALKQLTEAPGMEINPSFSPDGRTLAYQSDQSGRLELWLAGADGGSPRQLTQEGVTGHFERWLENGGAILYRCVCGGRNVVQKISAAGGSPTDLAWVKGGSHLSLSPDGTRILDVDGHKSLWLSTVAPGDARELFHFDDPGDRIDYPVWSPDGKAALFDRFRPQDGDLWLLEAGAAGAAGDR